MIEALRRVTDALEDLYDEHGQRPGCSQEQPQILYDGLRTARPDADGNVWQRAKAAMQRACSAMEIPLDDEAVWKFLVAHFGLEGITPEPTVVG